MRPLTIRFLFLAMILAMLTSASCAQTAADKQDAGHNRAGTDILGEKSRRPLPEDVKNGFVDITYYGHAMFKVNEEGGESIVIDPFNAELGYTMPDVEAQYVLISHNDPEHANTDLVSGDHENVQSLGDSILGEMMFRGVKSFHDDVSGCERGENIIFKWVNGGLTFVHMGDFGQPSIIKAQLDQIGKVDILFVPIGGGETIGPAEAVTLIQAIQPRIAIPMHYKLTDKYAGRLLGITDFTALVSNTVYKPSTVKVNRDTLPETPQVWVMDF